MDNICLHCQQRIVVIDFVSGPKWMHNPSVGELYEFCQLKAAEPDIGEVRYGGSEPTSGGD